MLNYFFVCDKLFRGDYMNLFEKLAKERKEPLKIIHGTDWWTDCDDVAALRLLCRAHSSGAVELQCVCADAVMDKTAASLSAFILDSGVDVPIGIDRKYSGNPERCKYQHVLEKYPHKVTNEDCEEAYRLYRRALANLDGKADITEIGFPQNIQYLMESEPDDISPLSGMELVREKVNKIWLMAGKWDEENGKEYNISANPAASKAGSYIFENSPVPVTCLGWEVGNTVITGGKADENDLVKVAFNAHGSVNGRCSWDPMLVLMAIINDEEAAGYDVVRGKATVDPETGRNNFAVGEGNHAYVVKKYDDGYYADMIDELIK